VTLTSPITVTANFAITTVNLNISKIGTGSGTVTSNPAGMECGATCSKVYDYGTSLTLTAVADAGSAFKGWSGGCSGSGDCVPDLTADASVAAEFIAVPPLTLAAAPLPNGEVGLNYDLPLVSGGLPPYTVTVIKGALPAGLSIDPNTGMLNGKPIIGKSASFTVQVTFPSGPAVTGTYRHIIRKQLLLATTTVKSGTHNKAYSATLKATGGKLPYVWTLSSGNLPTGFTLSPTGVISGTTTDTGGFDIDVEVTDALGGSETKSFTLTIN
jgi:hypothetical protein